MVNFCKSIGKFGFIEQSYMLVLNFSIGSARTSATFNRSKPMQLSQTLTGTTKTFSLQNAASMSEDPRKTKLDHNKPTTENKRRYTIDSVLSVGLNQRYSPAYTPTVPSRQNNPLVGDIGKMAFS